MFEEYSAEKFLTEKMYNSTQQDIYLFIESTISERAII